ncbi:hypothetical protein VF14_33285 [Nostoc linckia z18]|jgi:hypothetical protein|uniref:Uncharacterized protein n=2 Tax=Nostoc linckia TaxID=92942 RepID=A0A9Q5ZDM0_NOSLI|nr:MULTISPECIES: hypothetical protein [Nostoc]PHK30516.1 hypothetical protein VF12_29545 [Nostoc linckia z15]PHK40692.1 hypothetical protein VF13_32570 [Nostoc linckia z16]MBC1239373.1 hypothetical protein [Nostoc sp. 2RC]PHJ60923.1 hypothetical protein VF02_20990 [Nostoc linckia z1]PHJ64659.1 hypothetical protein VF05_22200 [Nostoc linckia z3]
MTIVRKNSPNTSVIPPETLAEKFIEAERMHDVLLLLQNLINSEEATVKLILDCLYDVGSVNLINQKLRPQPINRLMKLIARMSKPVFRTLAYNWFKKNCPQLIANWLHSQVTFGSTPAKPREVAIEVTPVEPYSALQAESLNQEIKTLRHQVRLLAGISIIAIAVLGVTATWLN